ncbi:MAG: hypothetical protein LBI96_01720 [Odoribacteraceae bacterium]|jgi:cell division protein FtsA|nr:hypothetical protein [Odoribacteraceae bacterium]
MKYVASLDMGSETMVMALAEVSTGLTRVQKVERIPSEGIERGRVRNAGLARESVRQLQEVFSQKHGIVIDQLRVALPMSWLRRVSREESASFPRPRWLDDSHLAALKRQALASFLDDDREVVSILPRSYVVDGAPVQDPTGLQATRLDASYTLYSAREADLEAARAWFKEIKIEVEFYAAVEAMSQALIAKEDGLRNVALIDLGAESVKVLVFQRGMVVRDAELPLGCRSIDEDLNRTFNIQSIDKARKLKHEYGMAIHAMEKNRKIIIPETKYSIHLHALLQVEQCRLEELLEGALFQIQRSGCYGKLTDGILLTGGGSLVKGVDTLTAKLSGHPVRKALIAGMSASEAWLRSPGYLTAFGLLDCVGKSAKRPRRSSGEGWLGKIFK